MESVRRRDLEHRVAWHRDAWPQAVVERVRVRHEGVVAVIAAVQEDHHEQALWRGRRRKSGSGHGAGWPGPHAEANAAGTPRAPPCAPVLPPTNPPPSVRCGNSASYSFLP